MFGFHPANLAFRFVLEISAFVALGAGGYTLARQPLAWILAVALPLIGSIVWGVFNVPGDRSRSGRAPVPVPGGIRLIIELAFFSCAVVLASFASPVAAGMLGVAVAVHYLLSRDRIRWLLSRSSGA